MNKVLSYVSAASGRNKLSQSLISIIGSYNTSDVHKYTFLKQLNLIIWLEHKK